MRLNDQPRDDLPIEEEEGSWLFRYERNLQQDPATWLDADVAGHDMKWRSWEQPERKSMDGLYGGYITWALEFPYPVAFVKASATVANHADSVVRNAHIEYSLDSLDYLPLAETTYGAEQASFTGRADVGEENINRLWVRVRQGSRDTSALRSGAVVFKRVDLVVGGPVRELTPEQAEASRAWIARRREARLEQERRLLEVAGVQAEAVTDFNEALMIHHAAARARYYMMGKPPDHQDTPKLRALEKGLRDLERRFLTLYHSYLGPTRDREGQKVVLSEEARTLTEDPDARAVAHQQFVSDCTALRDRARLLVEAARGELESLRRNETKRSGHGPLKPTPRFRDKPPARLRAGGTATGIIFGMPYEHDRKPGSVPLGIDYLSGVYDKYHTDYEVSPVTAGAELGLKTQIIVPCAAHENLYCPIDWFLERREEPILRRNAPDPSSYRGQWMWPLDFHHPDVREMLAEFLAGVGERYRDDDRIFTYTTAWEPQLNEGSIGEWGRWPSGGRTPAANGAFRAYLREKLGTIEALNAAWESEYLSFGAIEPPADVHHGPPEERATLLSQLNRGACPPLYYEHNRFLLDSYAEYLAWCYQTLKAADPDTPISVSPSYGLIDGYLAVGRDSFQWAEKACDIYGSEMTSSMEEVFQYSIQRALDRPTGIFEFIWNGPENWSNPSEDVARAAARRNLWRMVAWGRTVIALFGYGDTYGGKAYNNMAVFESDSHLLRRSAGIIGPLKRKLRSMEDVWLKVPVIEPKIALLKPSTSQICAWPWEIVTSVSQGLHDVLHGNQYHYAFVPEEHVLLGRDHLERYRVLVLPHASHFPPGLTERILPWVKSGGVLIVSGIAGGFTPYGRRDGALMEAVFGELEYQSWLVDGVGGELRWMLTVDELRPQAEYVGDRPGEILLARYGRGKVLLAARLADLAPGGAAVPIMHQLIDGAAPRRVWVEGAQLEMVARGTDRRWHVVLINPSSSRPAEARICLARPCRRAVDRGIEGGFPIPVQTAERGEYFDTVLAPGEGTMVQIDW